MIDKGKYLYPEQAGVNLYTYVTNTTTL